MLSRDQPGAERRQQPVTGEIALRLVPRDAGGRAASRIQVGYDRPVGAKNPRVHVHLEAALCMGEAACDVGAVEGRAKGVTEKLASKSVVAYQRARTALVDAGLQSVRVDVQGR